MALDLREAFNTISDVVQNRPLPLREFDQIYMKVGDMVIHAEFVSRQFDKKNLVFIGDGDSVSLSIAHLMSKNILIYGPEKITVLDFDERIVKAINKFAESKGITGLIHAELYNVIDPLPSNYINSAGGFHINPPWGASNDGESVSVFLDRGIESIGENGTGVIVIADDPDIEWTQIVLRNTQLQAIKQGFVIREMIPGVHSYHLDDAPQLKSCTLVIQRIASVIPTVSKSIDENRLNNFYGKDSRLKYHYIRDKSGIHFGQAEAESYFLEPIKR